MATVQLSAEETALYDRQIRLWGVDAQHRLQKAKVLVVNVTSLAAELCKNIVLAGIGAVTLLDDHIVTEEDLCANFLLSSESAVGQNRAQAALQRLGVLNPRVQLTATSGPVTAELVAGFDVVCAIHLPGHQLVEIDRVCREKGVKFFAGDLFGMLGVLFADLQSHSYVEERKQPSAKNKDETETTVVPKQETYVSLEQALAKTFTGLSDRKLKNLDKNLFVLQGLWNYWHAHGSLPDPIANPASTAEFVLAAQQVLQAKGLAPATIDEKALGLVAEGALAEISPVAAIVGGFFAQEVLKTVSGKELPINNFFFYDGFQGTGNVEQVEP